MIDPEKIARLGSVETDVLEAIREHGKWHPYSRWSWDGPGKTKRIMDSLVRKGYVTVIAGGAEWNGDKIDVYVPAERAIEEEITTIQRLAGLETG